MRLFPILHTALTHTALITGGLLYLHDPGAFQDRLAQVGGVLNAAINGETEGGEAVRGVGDRIEAKVEGTRQEIATATAKFLKAPLGD